MRTASGTIDDFADLLLNVAVMLISNGANSTRTARNLKRIADAFGYHIEQFFSHSAVVMTVSDLETSERRTLVKKIPHYGVNYSIVSSISILTWEIQDGMYGLEEIKSRLKTISHENSYPEWMKFVMIGLATAALSKIFAGTNEEFFVAFLAAVTGMFIRKLFLVRQFNVNICWFIGAFVSTSVVNMFRLSGMQEYHAALTACVLWLIPGVPLINGFLDIFSGHVVSGWAKVSMGVLMVFMISVGFYLSLFVFGYG